MITMMCCVPTGYRSRRFQAIYHPGKLSPKEPNIVQFATESPSFPQDTWLFAKLSSDRGSSENYISKALVETTLKMQFHPLNDEQKQQIKSRQLGGSYVDLRWRHEDFPDIINGPTRFIISIEADPPYDAVLGKRESKNHKPWA